MLSFAITIPHHSWALLTFEQLFRPFITQLNAIRTHG
jgi:hypothetical protein